MMNMLFPLIALATVFSATPASEGALTPEHLRCEYLVDPLGIDVTEPRLSWELRPTNDKARELRQTRYRLQVAWSPELLAEDTHFAARTEFADTDASRRSCRDGD
jgi:alpha-L-rhamnosidase